MRMIERIANYIKEHDGFTILTHVAPDGDTLGSGIALYGALLALGKKASLKNPSPLPATYDFLPYYPCFNAGKRYPNVIAVDCADKSRMSHYSTMFENANFSIMIDHHATNEGGGDLSWVEPAASAAGEMVYELIEQLGCMMTGEIALGIYTAISTDTGNFTYSNTSAKCMRYCAQLLEYIDVAKVAELLYRTRTFSKTMLIKSFLEHLELSADKRVAVSYITLEDLKADSSSPSETDNIIDFARDIATVEAAAFVLEVRPGEYKIGLRSKTCVDVSAVAGRHNGGGHRRAAGCKMFGQLADILRQIMLELMGELQ